MGLGWTELLTQTAPWTPAAPLFAGAPLPRPFSADPPFLACGTVRPQNPAAVSTAQQILAVMHVDIRV